MRNPSSNGSALDADSTTIDVTTGDPDQVIAEVLGDQPRAAYWRELRLVLADRLKALKNEQREVAPQSPDFVGLQKRIDEMRQQIQALATEEAVTQFIEDQIRASVNRPVHPGQFPFAIDIDGEYEE